MARASEKHVVVLRMFAYKLDFANLTPAGSRSAATSNLDCTRNSLTYPELLSTDWCGLAHMRLHLGLHEAEAVISAAAKVFGRDKHC